MSMTDRTIKKKDTRSSITVHLSAAYADFIVELLTRELDEAHGEGQASLAATIQEILDPFRNALELEEKQRALRGRQ